MGIARCSVPQQPANRTAQQRQKKAIRGGNTPKMDASCLAFLPFSAHRTQVVKNNFFKRTIKEISFFLFVFGFLSRAKRPSWAPIPAPAQYLWRHCAVLYKQIILLPGVLASIPAAVCYSSHQPFTANGLSIVREFRYAF